MRCCNCQQVSDKKYCSTGCKSEFVAKAAVDKLELYDLKDAFCAMHSRESVLYRIAPPEIKELMEKISRKYPVSLPSDYELVKR